MAGKYNWLRVYDMIHVKLVSIQSKPCAKPAHKFWDILSIDGLVQERCNSSAFNTGVTSFLH